MKFIMGEKIMTSPKEVLELAQVRLRNVDPQGIETDTYRAVEAAIPVAELHQQAVKGVPNLLAMMRTAIEIIEREIPDCETFKEKAFIDKMDTLLAQIEALK